MDTLLKDIQTRLVEIPALKYVDEDWGQLDLYGTHPPVQFPASTIDIVQGDFSNQGKLIQSGLIQVKVKIADQKLTNTSARAPQGQKDNAFAIYATIKLVHQKLHGWAGSLHYSKLIRKSLRKYFTQDGLRIFEIIYTTELTDAGAMPATVISPATVNIQPGPALA